MAEITFTFNSERLTPAERATLDRISSAYRNRSMRVAKLMEWLAVTETMANALIAYYLHNQSWRSIGAELGRSPDALRVRAAQIRNEYDARFWEVINLVKNME